VHHNKTVLRYNNTILYTNVMSIIENFVVSKKINHIYIALSQNRFVLSDLLIIVDLSKCEKALYFMYQGKKAPLGSFYKNE